MQISVHLFELLEEHGIKTHYRRMINDTEMLVTAVDIVPLEVIPRNIAAGRLSGSVRLRKASHSLRRTGSSS